ncbi:class F sortase [Actinomadura sp. CNU-125]|uniref:class F sortase n=1 Tax=Actinomadura sp. CNU-125 TaxID=1904961 RepID=UPI0011782748|nr:class F sortase [Actinomadura sp. CNU-125]
MAVLVGGLVIALGAAALAIAFHRPAATDAGRRPDFAAVPTERAPNGTNPTGPVADAGRPVELIVPQRDVAAPITPVGVDRKGRMAIPDDPAKVGWYRYGAAPGEGAGSVVIAGHVDSATSGLGALAALRGIEPGEDVRVRMSDGPSVRYRVVSREYIVKQAVPYQTLFARDGAPRLTLITCGGPFIERLGSYRDNLIVTAVPAGSAATPRSRA